MQKIDDEKSKGIAIQKEKMNDLQDGIDQLAPLIDTLRKTGDDLIRLSGPGAASDQVKKQVENLEDRWDKLSKRVQEKGRRFLLHAYILLKGVLDCVSQAL